MTLRYLVLCLVAVCFLGCKKFTETPKEACFIPYVDFVAHHVDPSTLEVTFSAVTSYNGTITSHKWDFGDGTTFTGPVPPPHQYPAQAPGSATQTYRIKYTATNECGESFWTKDIVIGACLPNVQFTYVFLNDSTVQFTNTSTSPTPATYLWNFGDGNTSTSSATTITRTYGQDHNYTVSLKATNACGENNFTRQVSVCKAAVPSQTITVASCATVNVNASATQNGARYQWNFGNGTVLPAAYSTSPTISYTYPQPGNYTITLSVINPGGCDTATVSNTIQVSGGNLVPNNNWAYQSDDMDFTFSRSPVVNATGYTWNFGDGNSSTQQSPGLKTYATPGSYNLTLGATGGCSGPYSFSSTLSAPYYRSISNLPNTGFQEVLAISPHLIYFLSTSGRLYRADTAGSWSGPINLPSGLSFNSDTRLYKDPANNLWIYGRREVARFNPATSTWTSSYNATGFSNNVTIEGIAVDNNGTLWTVGNKQVRKGNNVISNGNSNEYASIAFSPASARVWVTASNRNSLYYANTNGTSLNEVQQAGIIGGAHSIRALSNGELFFITGTGIGRTNASGVATQQFNALNTAGFLTGSPRHFVPDNEGNLWVLHNGNLIKIPLDATNSTKKYSYNADLSALSFFDVLHLGGTDNDLILTKTSGHAAIKVK